MVKNLPAMRETQVQSLGREDPLEKEMTTHCSILVWEIPWTEESGGLQSMRLQRVRHDWVNNIAICTCTVFILLSSSVVPANLNILFMFGESAVYNTELAKEFIWVFPLRSENPGLTLWLSQYLSSRQRPEIPLPRLLCSLDTGLPSGSTRGTHHTGLHKDNEEPGSERGNVLLVRRVPEMASFRTCKNLRRVLPALVAGVLYSTSSQWVPSYVLWVPSTAAAAPGFPGSIFSSGQLCIMTLTIAPQIRVLDFVLWPPTPFWAAHLF